MKDLSFDEIIDLLKECDDAYFNESQSTLSDSEYDKLKRKAFIMDPSNDYFIKVGSEVRGGKIKLPYTMGSLNQLYNDAEITNWLTKYSPIESECVLSDKLDGVSVMLVYNNGTLSIAYSRGDGINGADITRHVKGLSLLPLNLLGANVPNYLVLRGEAIMKVDTFINKYSSEYKNPRNLVAGALNRKETDESILSDIDFIAYKIVDISKDFVVHTASNGDSLTLLKNLGFSVVDYAIFDKKKLSFDDLSDILRESKEDSYYELDGIVISVNNYKTVVSQTSSSTLNPEDSFKFKINDSSSFVTTIVKNVEWNISKHGLLKPRVEVIPVDINGVTVSFVTGHNAKFIRDNGIGKNAKITITRSGDVIPYIVNCIMKTTPLLPDDSIKWRFNDNDVEAELLDKENNNEVIFQQVLDFLETINVDLFKEATLRHMWNDLVASNGLDYDNIISTIYDLSEYEWKSFVGANGVKIYNSLQRKSSMKLETYLGAVKYMGVGFGVRKSKKLLASLNNPLESVWKLSVEDIMEIDGFDTKTAGQAHAGLVKSKTLLTKLINSGVITIVEEVKTAELSNVNAVMTGFRDNDLQAKIESMGGKVSSGVSKKTTHLLALDANSNSTKLKKARDLGVIVITPEDFKELFNL